MHKDNKQNRKYLTRCHYYGKLLNWNYIAGAMILELRTYTATEYFGGSSTVRLYVPTELESSLSRALIVGNNYFVVAAPYKMRYADTYRYRVDLLLNIFEEIV
ncbi:MAG: hypothetical protein NC218_08105 [Acetobacter sp.]|nr:hypothetical protein [Acetobacter sp.]